MKCDYKCGNEAKHVLANGKHCCESNCQRCPCIKKKNSDGLKLAYKEGRKNTDHFKGKRNWAKGKTSLSDSRIYVSKNPTKSTIRNWVTEKYGYICSECELVDWRGTPLTLEVDHIDGNNFNNDIENLRFLCPNCHSQTKHWRGRNINNLGRKKVSDEKLLESLENHNSIHAALKGVGLTPKGGNYKRCYELLNQGN